MPQRPQQHRCDFIDFEQLFRACALSPSDEDRDEANSMRQARLRRVMHLAMETHLTEIERQTLTLYYSGKHTQSEIAALTGTNPSTVCRNLRRGKDKLMHLLQYYLFD